MPASARDHIVEIEHVVLGLDGRAGILRRDAAVKASWRPCVENHRLKPGRGHEVHILPQHRLREHQERTEQLIRMSRSALEGLYRLIGAHGYILVLADPSGVAVDYIGDPTFENQLRKAGLFLGAEWSEARAGTCGVGSCIVTGEALTIHQEDHFDVEHTPLTCTAAPIYDAVGNIAAVLDISALRSPESKLSQALFLQTLTTTARRIEVAGLMESARSEWVLRFSHAPDTVAVDPDGAVSLDGAGRILGATRTGHKLLAAGAGLEVGDMGQIVGRPISDFLDFDVNDLPSFTCPTSLGAAPAARLIRGRSGNAVFGQAVSPRPAPSPKRPGSPVSRAAAFAPLSGGDPAMADVIRMVNKVAPTRLPILIQGETGTGKERLARAIHEASRPSHRLVTVNCAALPDTLIEGELFGYAPGSFTGANAKGRKGLIEEADGGTLFLDEIGDMALPLQARLLRVLSEGEVVPLGSARPIPIDVRIVSATHQDLPALVARRQFREDLYHRLAGTVVTVPGLRLRSDFDWLVDRLLLETDQPQLGLSREARAVLKQHPWPGNVRELRNALTLAAAMAEGGCIDVCDLPYSVTQDARCSGNSAVSAATPDCLLAASERGQLQACLDRHGWNVSAVARELDLDRSTVHRRIKRLALPSPKPQAF